MNTVHGTPNDDYIEAPPGQDVVIFGYAGNDTLIGKDGDDIIHGGPGDDVLLGCEGDDALYGEHGNDRLEGGPGNDRLYGGDGDDILNGGPGHDRLYGGRGNDLYLYQPGNGIDIIDDESGYDTLRLIQIQAADIRLQPAHGTWLWVVYRGEAIIRMRGIERIVTDDGEFAVDPPSAALIPMVR